MSQLVLNSNLEIVIVDTLKKTCGKAIYLDIKTNLLGQIGLFETATLFLKIHTILKYFLSHINKFQLTAK